MSGWSNVGSVPRGILPAHAETALQLLWVGLHDALADMPAVQLEAEARAMIAGEQQVPAPHLPTMAAAFPTRALRNHEGAFRPPAEFSRRGLCRLDRMLPETDLHTEVERFALAAAEESARRAAGRVWA